MIRMIKLFKNTPQQHIKKHSFIYLLSGILILVSIAVVSSFLHFRFDLTQDKRYSLSKSTVEMLKQLDDNLYVKVYLEGDMPPDYKQFAQALKFKLEEYARHSNRIHFEFIDPVKGKDKKEANEIYAQLYKKGLTAIPVSAEKDGTYTSKIIVPGAVLSYKGNDLAAPLIVSDPQGDYWLEYSIQELEYNLSSVIRRLITQKRPTVAFLDGHGELDPVNTSWVMWQLQKFYNVTRATIDGKINALRDIEIADSVQQELRVKGNKYDVLVIAQPTQKFSEQDKFIIDQFIMRGGRVLWLIDATNAALDSLSNTPEMYALPMDLNLENLFFAYGVRMNANLVQDLKCQKIPLVSGYIGDQPQFKFMPFPYYPELTFMSPHPIVRRVKSLKADFMGTIDTIGSKSEVSKHVLVQTSNLTKTVPVPAIVSLAVGKKTPNPQEYGFRNLPVVVLVEGNFKSAFSGIIPIEIEQSKDIDFKETGEPARQIFIADGDMIRNVLDGKNQSMPAGYDRYNNILYDNTEFIINCINYLCDDDDLLNLRAKNFKIGKLDPGFIKKESRFWIIFNLTVPSALILLLGGVLVIIRIRKYGKKVETLKFIPKSFNR